MFDYYYYYFFFKFELFNFIRKKKKCEIENSYSLTYLWDQLGVVLNSKWFHFKVF